MDSDFPVLPHVVREEVQALDAATTLPLVYPTWFSERLMDGDLEKVLA